MKKNKNIFVIGTSHTADVNHDGHHEVGYPKHHLNEDTWPEYLGKQLNCNVINAGICAYGEDSYFPRILNIIKHNKNVEFLIEIPTPGRFEIFFNSSFYKKNSMMDESDFWIHGNSSLQPDPKFDSNNLDILPKNIKKLKLGKTKNVIEVMEQLRNTRFPFVYAFSKDDAIYFKSNNITSSILNPRDKGIAFLRKVAVQHNKSTFVTKKQMESISRLYLTTNHSMEKEMGFIKCAVIDGFLKKMKIPVAWFFTSASDKHNSFKSIDNEMDVIYNKKPLFSYFLKKGLSSSNKLYWREIMVKEDKETFKKLFPDKSHLIGKGWKELVDNIIVPYYNKRND